MPDSIRSWGELNAPPESSTSRAAWAMRSRPPWSQATPRARPPSSTTRVASARVLTVRLGRRIAGLSQATAAEHRRPSRIVHWLRPKPSWRAPL